MTAMLEVENLHAHYGSVQALFGVSLAVEQGEVVALMGRNGMGKTTTIRTICRMMAPSGGSVRFAGRDLSPLASHQAARLGIGLVPEGRRCFPNLTVEENLVAAARPGEWDLERVGSLFPRLKERRGQYANTLSGGEQQMLAIGRALMTNPRLLILDEATEGLAPVVRAEIWDAVAKLKAAGFAILLVDKSLKELLRIIDRAVIVERGSDVWQGNSAELTGEVSSRYLGL